MSEQLELGDKPEDRPCEWCGAGPGLRRVVGTFACVLCAAASARERVIAALRRWSRR